MWRVGSSAAELGGDWLRVSTRSFWCLRRFSRNPVNPLGTALVFVAFHQSVFAEPRTSLIDQTFYPLTLPLTTGRDHSRWR